MHTLSSPSFSSFFSLSLFPSLVHLNSFAFLVVLLIFGRRVAVPLHIIGRPKGRDEGGLLRGFPSLSPFSTRPYLTPERLAGSGVHKLAPLIASSSHLPSLFPLLSLPFLLSITFLSSIFFFFHRIHLIYLIGSRNLSNRSGSISS